MHEEAVKEVNRRIKRLEAEIEILENSLDNLEREPQKIAPKFTNNALYYTIFIGLWMLAGIGTIIYLINSRRLPDMINVPLLPYVLIATVILLGGLVYVVWERHEVEKLNQKGELEEKIRSANLVVKNFYEPLKKILIEDDKEELRTLAERLLEDPLLQDAVEKVNEGNPKVMAYAIYLYTVYTPEMKDEVEDLLGTLRNRVLRALLEELISTEP